MRALLRLGKLLHREPWWSEWWAAWGALLWARWVTAQQSALEAHPAYTIVADVMSDGRWACTAYVIGTAQLAAVALDFRWGRVIATFPASAFWLTLAWGLWLHDRAALGTSVYLILGMSNMASGLLLTLGRDKDG